MNNDHSFTHNAQSLNPAPAEHAYVVLPDKPEHAYVADEPIAKSTKLKRTTIYLDAQHLSQLAAVDDMPAAWHVRRAIAAYLDRLTTPVAQDQLASSITSAMATGRY